MVDFTNAHLNPTFIAGISQVNPGVGNSLAQAAGLQMQQQEQSRHQQAFQNEQAEQQRLMMLQQRLPEVLGQIDWNNPQQAQSQLASLGLKPQEMATLFNIHAGGQELGFRGEEIGLKREGLGLERQALGLRERQMLEQMRGSVSPEEAVKIEKELRGEVAKESGEYKIVKSAFNKVREAAKNPSPANDVALLYGYMKLLDPGSVVRESEYATAENAGSVPTRVQNLYNKAINGEKLTAAQRKDFVDSAKGQYKSQVKSIKEVTSQYKKLAETYKVNPQNVVLFEPEELPAEEVNVMPNTAPQGSLQQLSDEELKQLLRQFK